MVLCLFIVVCLCGIVNVLFEFGLGCGVVHITIVREGVVSVL